MISASRLEERLAHIRSLTAPNGGAGIMRLAFTDSDWACRAYLLSLMKDAGLSCREDAFGNIIAHRAGRREDLPAVMFGSHGDSVPHGGNFDGIVGILSAIEVAKSLEEDGIETDAPLEIVLFMCEESSRFGAATLGSRAMRGKLTQEDLTRLKDKDGVTLREALLSRHLHPEALASARYDKPLKAFFEVHIEQGRVLESMKKDIGIVTGIVAPTRMRIHLHGRADHSGATPMNLRADGLCAAAEIILAVEREARLHTEPPVVGTVGTVDVEPGAMNVIPGEVTIGVDIRSISAEAKAEAAAHIEDFARQAAAARHIPLTIEHLGCGTPAPISREMVSFLAGLCEKDGISCMTLPSGAGHDAMHWPDYTQVGMLFIPCRDGISHNPRESAELADIARVAKLLEQAVRQAARADFRFS
ncbi:M20 family metallo-hydrolase [uncultured Mitsuokella sp.]|uniref:M20 family metallo-hydrolase n=1 Tax=uncultured Mitsuokella sp. TaxID=453120 RepID=UPI0026173A54|nr:M20 family metallo-hydrolase [uncultured Mitsuokella sp.]